MNQYGYLKIGSAVPEIKIGDICFNADQIWKMIENAASKGVEILVFPELSITGYSCGDLFSQDLLLKKAEEGIAELIGKTSTINMLIAVGCPVLANGKRYNCAVVFGEGKLYGIVPKQFIPNYGEFYEKRWFESGRDIKAFPFSFGGQNILFSDKLIFSYNGAHLGLEICEDLWVPEPPSGKLSLAGCDIIMNLSATNEVLGKNSYLKNLISQQSARCRCAYAYSSAGWGESSTDLVFSGNAIIAENGRILASSDRFSIETLISIASVDIEKLRLERIKYNSFYDRTDISKEYTFIDCNNLSKKNLFKEKLSFVGEDKLPDFYVDPWPFVPKDKEKLRTNCEEITNIQVYGLIRRLNAIGCKKAVIGISGGLDSTLALLVTVKAFDKLGIDRKNIIGVTMPGEATSSRTKNNATLLMESLQVTSLEIPIAESISCHFKDIAQPENLFDITYENSQARERTQILMDLANKENAIVIGTGDLSELALGWCTYNGDHMSMYSVNASIPKTLIKYLVEWYATILPKNIGKILLDIISTPISPELVPSKDGSLQDTEKLVGPYELHDFFLFHFLRNSFSPGKILWLAKAAFKNKYDDKVILKWLENFYRRFFSQQFKRSCMPDGPKVGSVCLSPRGDWRMPSDATATLWLKEVESLKKKMQLINGKELQGE